MHKMSLTALQEKFCKKLASDKHNTVIIDIRSPEEYQHEHIPGAINIPINQLAELKASQYADKVAIFHCRSGSRTSMNEQAIDATPFKEKYCLQGGINEWKSANLAVNTTTAAPIDVTRQMQLIVGSLILLSLVLGVWVWSYFLIITALMGLGLFIAGLTGFCGMVVMLKHMPWNKSRGGV